MQPYPVPCSVKSGINRNTSTHDNQAMSLQRAPPSVPRDPFFHPMALLGLWKGHNTIQVTQSLGFWAGKQVEALGPWKHIEEHLVIDTRFITIYIIYMYIYTYRSIKRTTPYLLPHLVNPVAWTDEGPNRTRKLNWHLSQICTPCHYPALPGLRVGGEDS